MQTERSSNLEEEIAANEDLARALAGQPFSPPYQPTPCAPLVRAVHSWLTSHGHELETLRTGAALLHASSQPPARTLRRRLKRFARAVKSLSLPKEIVPHECDIRDARCWPRVLLAVAHGARTTDPDGWAAAGGGELPGKWEDVALNERWKGDDLAREIVNLTGGCTIVVAGSQGSGKSATISTLLGKIIIPHSHALTFLPSVDVLNEEQRAQMYKYRQISAACWPLSPIEMDLPVGNDSVDRAYAKLDDKALQFIELPCMEFEIESIDIVGTRVGKQYGEFHEVLHELQRDLADAVLLVERMDDLSVERLRNAARKLQRLYGRAVWNRTIVVLTHGNSLPPGDMQYAVWKFDCIRTARDIVKKVGGEDVLVLVGDNSGDMPDGSVFATEFLEAFRQVSRGPGIKSVPPRRWWEDYLIIGLSALIVPQIL